MADTDDAPEISRPPLTNGMGPLEKLSENLRHQLREAPKLAKALVVAQLNMSTAKKNAKNPHFGKTYADLAAVREACQPALNSAGVAVVQCVGKAGTDVSVTTALVHESGEAIVATVAHPPPGSDIQKAGSTISYLRRYGLSAMVSLAQEDDDGNAASAPAANPAGSPAVRRFESMYSAANTETELKTVDLEIRDAGLPTPERNYLRGRRAEAKKRIGES